MGAKDKTKHLALEPADKVKFTGSLSSELHTTLKITNNSDTKQSFKVKCTSNEIFRIRPVVGIIESGQSANVTLFYKPTGETPESDFHHFGVYHIPAPEGCSPYGVWEEHYGPPQGEYRLKVTFDEKTK